MDFDNLDLFLEAVKGEEKFISERIKYNLPIYYEINSGQIVFNSYDGKRFFVDFHRSRLYETMEKIAVYTNNDLDCGCVFTIGCVFTMY